MEDKKMIIELLKEIKQEQQNLKHCVNEIDKRLNKAYEIMNLMINSVEIADSNLNSLASENIESTAKEIRMSTKSNHFDDLDGLWNLALSRIMNMVSKPSFETWIKSTKMMSYNKGISLATIAAPNSFARDWLENHYTHLITGILTDLTGEDLTVEFLNLKDC